MTMLSARMPSPLQTMLLLMKVRTRITKNKRAKKRKRRLVRDQKLQKTLPLKEN